MIPYVTPQDGCVVSYTRERDQNPVQTPDIGLETPSGNRTIQRLHLYTIYNIWFKIKITRKIHLFLLQFLPLPHPPPSEKSSSKRYHVTTIVLFWSNSEILAWDRWHEKEWQYLGFIYCTHFIQGSQVLAVTSPDLRNHGSMEARMLDGCWAVAWGGKSLG